MRRQWIGVRPRRVHHGRRAGQWLRCRWEQLRRAVRRFRTGDGHTGTPLRRRLPASGDRELSLRGGPGDIKRGRTGTLRYRLIENWAGE